MKGLIYRLLPVESSIKDETLTLTAKLSDNTGNIQITVSVSLVNEIKEDNAFSFTTMKDSSFQSDYLIKSVCHNIFHHPSAPVFVSYIEETSLTLIIPHQK